MPTYLKSFSPLIYDAPAPRTQNDIEIKDATITRSAGDNRILTITFGGAGGATSRFGVAGEDDVANEDRTVDMANNALLIEQGKSIDLHVGDWNEGYSEIYTTVVGDGTGDITGASATISAFSQDQSQYGSIVVIGENTTGGVNILWHGASDTWRMEVKEGIKFHGGADVVTIPSGTGYATLAVNDQYADAAGKITISTGRFGYPTEDVTSDANRYIDMQENSLTIDLASLFEFWATDVDFTYHAHIVGDSNNLRLESENETGQAQSLLDATASQILVDTRYKAATGDAMNYSSMSLQPKWILSNPGEEIFNARFFSTLANTASGQGSDLRLPYLAGGIHWIAAVRDEDDFADDAAAATGGVKLGQYYHTAGTVKKRMS